MFFKVPTFCNGRPCTAPLISNTKILHSKITIYNNTNNMMSKKKNIFKKSKGEATFTVTVRSRA